MGVEPAAGSVTAVPSSFNADAVSCVCATPASCAPPWLDDFRFFREDGGAHAAASLRFLLGVTSGERGMDLDLKANVSPSWMPKLDRRVVTIPECRGGGWFAISTNFTNEGCKKANGFL